MKKIIFSLIILLSAARAFCGDDYTKNGTPGNLYNLRGDVIATYNTYGALEGRALNLDAILRDAHRDGINWRDNQGNLVATPVRPAQSAAMAATPTAHHAQAGAAAAATTADITTPSSLAPATPAAPSAPSRAAQAAAASGWGESADGESADTDEKEATRSFGAASSSAPSALGKRKAQADSGTDTDSLAEASKEEDSTVSAPKKTKEEPKNAFPEPHIGIEMPAVLLPEILVYYFDTSSATALIKSLALLAFAQKNEWKNFEEAIVAALKKLEIETIVDPDKSNVLHVALASKMPAHMLQALLRGVKKEKMPLLLAARNNERMNPLEVAACGSPLEIVTLLVNQIPAEARPHVLLETLDEEHDSILTVAVQRSTFDVVEFLMNQIPAGERPATLLTRDANIVMPLLIAAGTNRDPRVVQFFLNVIPQENRVAAIFARDVHNDRLLYAATHNENPAVIRHVLGLLPPDKVRAAVTALDGDGNTLLRRSLSNNTFEITRFIWNLMPREFRAPNLAGLDREGNNALHLAAVNGNPDFTVFVWNNLPQNERLACLEEENDIDDSTPLHIAAAHDNAEVIRALILLGANPFLRNGEGYNTFDQRAEIVVVIKSALAEREGLLRAQARRRAAGAVITAQEEAPTIVLGMPYRAWQHNQIAQAARLTLSMIRTAPASASTASAASSATQSPSRPTAAAPNASLPVSSLAPTPAAIAYPRPQLPARPTIATAALAAIMPFSAGSSASSIPR